MPQQREPIVSIFQRIKAPFTESGEDEIAAAMPGPRPVGELLRERREELRLDIDGIGEVLRIKPAFLAALILQLARLHCFPHSMVLWKQFNANEMLSF